MKVLIIDDEPIVRRALFRVFSSKGHVVAFAENASEGERLWLQDRPDVVMLDVLMPKMTGPQLLAKLKPELPSLNAKIILMSAYSGEFDTKLTKTKGAHLFMAKPFDDIFSVVKVVEGLVE